MARPQSGDAPTTSTEQTSVRQLVERYVHQLKAQGAIRSSAVERAFHTVERHRLVETFYSGPPDFAPVRHDPEHPLANHLELIYSNTALGTRFVDGMPASSTSQPSLVAEMLELLDLAPGLNVLEIGAGTGYNAALMAELAGDQHLVVTLDVLQDVVEQTRRLLARAGYPQIAVLRRDGVQGAAERAPFDPGGDVCCWYPAGRDPATWPVVVCSRDGAGWQRYDLTSTALLCQWLAGRVRPAYHTPAQAPLRVRLARLVELLGVGDAGSVVDWPAVEAELGVGLPADYRAFVERFGAGSVNQELYIDTPLAPSAHFDLIAAHAQWAEGLRQLHQEFPEYEPYPPYAPPGGLLLWGKTNTRVSLFWRTDGPIRTPGRSCSLTTWTGSTVAVASSTSCWTTSPAGIFCRV